MGALEGSGIGLATAKRFAKKELTCLSLGAGKLSWIAKPLASIQQIEQQASDFEPKVL